MSGITLAVFGSYRPAEKNYIFFKSQEEFNDVCFDIGVAIAKSTHVKEYYMCFSNDFLELQLAPDNNKIPTYRIEDTADYNAMLGFISYLMINNEGGKKIKYSISKRMEKGGPSEVEGISIIDFWSRQFVNKLDKKTYTFKDVKHFFSEPVIIFNENSYRSHLTSYVLESSDLIILAGGGKASQILWMNNADMEKAILPLPYFGGIALKAFFSDASKKKKILGHEFKEIFDDIPKNDILKRFENLPQDPTGEYKTAFEYIKCNEHQIAEKFEKQLQLLLSEPGVNQKPESQKSVDSVNDVVVGRTGWDLASGLLKKIKIKHIAILLSIIILLSSILVATRVIIIKDNKFSINIGTTDSLNSKKTDSLQKINTHK